jgi:hypothetical protein
VIECDVRTGRQDDDKFIGAKNTSFYYYCVFLAEFNAVTMKFTGIHFLNIVMSWQVTLANTCLHCKTGGYLFRFVASLRVCIGSERRKISTHYRIALAAITF